MYPLNVILEGLRYETRDKIWNAPALRGSKRNRREIYQARRLTPCTLSCLCT